MVIDDRLLTAVTGLVRDEMLRTYPNNATCIGSVWCLCAALRHLRVTDVYALTVNLTIMNATLLACMKEHGRAPQTIEEAQAWRATGAYGMMTKSMDQAGPNEWAGHLVAIVYRRRLIDPTLDQYSRPQHGIILSPYITAVIEPALRGRVTMTTAVGNGTMVSYEARPGDKSYRQSPQWGDTDVNRAIVARVLDGLDMCIASMIR